MKKIYIISIYLLLITSSTKAMKDCEAHFFKYLNKLIDIIEAKNTQPITVIVKTNTSTNTATDVKTTQKKTGKPLKNIGDQDNIEKKSWLNSIQSYIANNKFKCAIGTLGTTYFIIYFFLDRGYRLVKNCDGWCAWKDHIELAHLTCQNCDELASELIQTIKENCLNMKNPSNFSSPLSQFLREINDEQVELERYISLGSRIIGLRLSPIFPVSKKLLFQARMRFERLKFVRKLFVQWNAKHNMGQTRLLC